MSCRLEPIRRLPLLLPEGRGGGGREVKRVVNKLAMSFSSCRT